MMERLSAGLLVLFLTAVQLVNAQNGDDGFSVNGSKECLACHDFGAEATGASYGSEWDLSVGRKFANRYDLLVKYADYAADELFTDTTKFWVQFAASF